MKLSDLSIRRPVLAVVMSLLLVVLGIMAFTRLTLRELPAIDPPIVSVDVSYPGASASVIARSGPERQSRSCMSASVSKRTRSTSSPLLPSSAPAIRCSTR